MSNITMISYKVKAECVTENSDLIKNVMAKLKSIKPEGLQYGAVLADDGTTFTHIVHAENPEILKIIPDLEEFKAFQQDLGNRCEQPPAVINANIVDSYGLF